MNQRRQRFAVSWLAVLGIVTSACSFDKTDSTSITLQIEPHSGTASIQDASSTLQYAPALVTGFDCFFINIAGEAIAPASPNFPFPTPEALDLMTQPDSVPDSSCSYPAISTGSFTLDGTEPVTVSMDGVPTGPRRIIQLVGVVDLTGNVCSLQGDFASVIDQAVQEAEATGVQPFEFYQVSKRVLDLFSDTVVDLDRNEYDASADLRVDCDLAGSAGSGEFGEFTYGTSEFVALQNSFESLPAQFIGDAPIVDRYELDTSYDPLPLGMVLDTATGEISGAAVSSVLIPRNIRVKAILANGQEEFVDFRMRVYPGLYVNTGTFVPDGTDDAVCDNGCNLLSAVHTLDDTGFHPGSPVVLKLRSAGGAYPTSSFVLNLPSTRDVVIRSDSLNKVVIDAANTVGIFDIPAGTTKTEFHGIDFRNGNGSGNGGSAIIFRGSGFAKVYDSVFVGNDAGVDNGGAIRTSGGGQLEVYRTSFRGNQADQGGAIYIGPGGKAIFDEVEFYNNMANEGSDGGGAIRSFDANFVAKSCLFKNNNAGGTFSIGGAIFAQGGIGTEEMLIENSTFYNNTADSTGGAIYYAANTSGANMLLRNNTFSDNAINNTNGKAFFMGAGPGSAEMANNIFQQSLGGGNDCVPAANFISRGGNISDESGACFTHINDIENTDARLLNLGHYGGFFETMPVDSSSIAIDTGVNGAQECASFDAHRTPRPQGGVCDPGAVEFFE